jgi:hypothetical protein
MYGEDPLRKRTWLELRDKAIRLFPERRSLENVAPPDPHVPEAADNVLPSLGGDVQLLHDDFPAADIVHEFTGRSQAYSYLLAKGEVDEQGEANPSIPYKLYLVAKSDDVKISKDDWLLSYTSGDWLMANRAEKHMNDNPDGAHVKCDWGSATDLVMIEAEGSGDAPPQTWRSILLPKVQSSHSDVTISNHTPWDGVQDKEVKMSDFVVDTGDRCPSNLCCTAMGSTSKYAYTHMQSHANNYVYMSVYIHTNLHSHAFLCTRTQAGCAHTRMHSRTHTCNNACIHAHPHTHKRAHAVNRCSRHTCTHMHEYIKYTQTSKHTKVHALLPGLSLTHTHTCMRALPR